MNLWDVGSETSVNDSVQTNKTRQGNTTIIEAPFIGSGCGRALSEWCCSVSM
jgi:hypothetical protein